MIRKFYALALFLLGGTVLQAQELIKSPLGQTSIGTFATPIKTFDEEEEEDAIWKQDRSYEIDEFSITSTHFDLADWGMYAADDFQLAGETTITGIYFHGSQTHEQGEDYVNGINIYIYKDADGKPDGNPSITESAYLGVYDIPVDSPHVEIKPGAEAYLGYKEYFIDIEGFLGEALSLSEGVYWISVVFNTELEENDFDIRWLFVNSSTENLNRPMVIDPTNGVGAGLTEWTKIEDAGFPMTDLAFTLYGETEVLSIPSHEVSDIKVYPNPTSDYLTLALEESMQVESVFATDLTGKRQALHLEGKRVSLNHLTAGTYIIQINTDKGALLKKVVKN